MLKMAKRSLPADDDLPIALERFYRRCRARNLSEQTTTYYRYRLLALSRYLDGQKVTPTLSALSTDILRGFLESEATHSPTTAYHSLLTLRVFFGFCIEEDLLSENPADKLESIRRNKPVIPTFTPAQIETLLTGCSGNTLHDLRDKAIFLLLLDCGLRVSELCGLTTNAIDFAGQTLRVLGKGNKERLLPFGRAVFLALKDYLAKRGQVDGAMTVFITVYGEPITRYRALDIIRQRCKQANITGLRCSPHTFRHTFAVMYLRNAGDCFTLQKLLGHTDLTMTRRYADMSETDMLDKHRACSPGDKFLDMAKPATGRKKLW